jgi:hypothetical protein
MVEGNDMPSKRTKQQAIRQALCSSKGIHNTRKLVEAAVHRLGLEQQFTPQQYQQCVRDTWVKIVLYYDNNQNFTKSKDDAERWCDIANIALLGVINTHITGSIRSVVQLDQGNLFAIADYNPLGGDAVIDEGNKADFVFADPLGLEFKEISRMLGMGDITLPASLTTSLKDVRAPNLEAEPSLSSAPRPRPTPPKSRL